jgi:nitrate reductase NapE component
MKLHTRLDRAAEQELRIRRSENASLFGGCLMVILTILASIAIYGAMIGFIVWVIVIVLRIMGVL